MKLYGGQYVAVRAPVEFLCSRLDRLKTDNIRLLPCICGLDIESSAFTHVADDVVVYGFLVDCR